MSQSRIFEIFISDQSSGKIKRWLVKKGEQVYFGTPLAEVLNGTKNDILKSPLEGKIESIDVTEGVEVKKKCVRTQRLGTSKTRLIDFYS